MLELLKGKLSETVLYSFSETPVLGVWTQLQAEESSELPHALRVRQGASVCLSILRLQVQAEVSHESALP